MRIYYIIHYFPPELNGGATRASDLARFWSAEGHEVTVLTGFPNHPDGVISEAHRGKFFLEENVENYKVRHTYVYATPNKGVYRRILNHLSLMCSSILGSLFASRPDIIIASSPPLFLGIAGYVLSRVMRVPLVFEVRDIWPQQAIDLGMLKGKRAISVFESLEKLLYRKADLIVGVAHSTKTILSNRAVPSQKITTITNAADLSEYSPGRPNPDIYLQLGLQDVLHEKFVVSYIGTMGLSQGLITVLEVARDLLNSHPSVHFLMVGDGAHRERLLKYSQENQLTNVTFLPPQPRGVLPELYRLSDVALVPLRNVDLFRSTIPSKLFEIMACGIPVILGVLGEAERIVREAQAGICVTPESAEELAHAILKLQSTPNARTEMARNGRKYVEKNYDRNSLAHEYIDALLSVLSKKNLGISKTKADNLVGD